MLQIFGILTLFLNAGQIAPDYGWEHYYYNSNFSYAEVNDIVTIGNETILCGGRWNDYSYQSDAEIVLMRHSSTGALIWEKCFFLDRGSIAYGISSNSHGNILVTGGTRLGTGYEALFLLELNPSNGSIINKYIVAPLAEIPFDMGYDVIQHSNGDYYIASSLGEEMCVVRIDSHTLNLTSWWNEPTVVDPPSSWAYANCINEIPAGYNESGMVVLGYTSKDSGAIIAVLDQSLNAIVMESFSFSCADASAYIPGSG